MDPEQATVILDSAANCAKATQDLFDAIDRRNAGTLTADESVEVVQTYCAAKEEFDSVIRTRGLIL